MFKLGIRILVVSLIVGLGVAAAFAQGTPSAKATFAFNKLVALQSGCGPSASCSATDPAGAGFQNILTQDIKMAQAKDLFIDASLQCGIVTDTTVKSLNGSEDTAEARGTIRVRVAVYKDGNLVGYASPDSGTDANQVAGAAGTGIVFCDRIQTLRAKFSGLNCTTEMNPLDPDYGEVTCADPEELELILKTLNANSFNFVAADLQQGVYTIVVQAKTSANVSTISSNGSLGSANAFIGAGSVAIEAVRMIKNEDAGAVEF